MTVYTIRVYPDTVVESPVFHVDALLVKHAACTLLGCKAGYHSAEGQIAANFVTREDRSWQLGSGIWNDDETRALPLSLVCALAEVAF